MTNWLSRWGKGSGAGAETQCPAGNEVTGASAKAPSESSPSPAVPVEDIVAACKMLDAAPVPMPIAEAMLCDQIAEALDGIPVGSLKKSGVTVNTLVRAKSGEGIRLETLEKIARYLGWTITITDKEGNPIVRAS